MLPWAQEQAAQKEVYKQERAKEKAALHQQEIEIAKRRLQDDLAFTETVEGEGRMDLDLQEWDKRRDIVLQAEKLKDLREKESQRLNNRQTTTLPQVTTQPRWQKADNFPASLAVPSDKSGLRLFFTAIGISIAGFFGISTCLLKPSHSHRQAPAAPVQEEADAQRETARVGNLE